MSLSRSSDPKWVAAGASSRGLRELPDAVPPLSTAAAAAEPVLPAPALARFAAPAEVDSDADGAGGGTSGGGATAGIFFSAGAAAAASGTAAIFGASCP